MPDIAETEDFGYLSRGKVMNIKGAKFVVICGLYSQLANNLYASYDKVKVYAHQVNLHDHSSLSIDHPT